MARRLRRGARPFDWTEPFLAGERRFLLATFDFLKQHNPDALREMSERLLEAAQRGLWEDPGERREKLEDLLLDLDQGIEV